MPWDNLSNSKKFHGTVTEARMFADNPLNDRARNGSGEDRLVTFAADHRVTSTDDRETYGNRIGADLSGAVCIVPIRR